MDRREGSVSDFGFRDWLALASCRSVVKRSLKTALVVGSILIVINHGSAIWQGDIGPERVWRMALTVIVPYLVSTSSSVCALREASRNQRIDSDCQGSN